MQPLTASKVRTSFGKVTRKVIRTQKPIVVATAEGLVQIAPYDPTETVPPAPASDYRPTPEEIHLSNTFGETL